MSRVSSTSFANPAVAEWTAGNLATGLDSTGAEDVTAGLRGRGPLTEVDGRTYLLPTLVHCNHLDHPLGNREFLFPYASLIEMPQAEMLEAIGPSQFLDELGDKCGELAAVWSQLKETLRA